MKLSRYLITGAFVLSTALAVGCRNYETKAALQRLAEFEKYDGIGNCRVSKKEDTDITVQTGDNKDTIKVRSVEEKDVSGVYKPIGYTKQGLAIVWGTDKKTGTLQIRMMPKSELEAFLKDKQNATKSDIEAKF